LHKLQGSIFTDSFSDDGISMVPDDDLQHHHSEGYEGTHKPHEDDEQHRPAWPDSEESRFVKTCFRIKWEMLTFMKVDR